MELHYQYYFFTLFSVVFVVSHAANLSPEVYWRVKLPNIPMPTPIKDALYISEKTAYNGDGNTKTSQPWGVGSWYQAAPENELHKVRQPIGVRLWYHAAPENELHKLRQPIGVRLWYHAAPENELHKLRQPFGVRSWYHDAAKKDLDENHLVTPYFFETDLHQGKKMNLQSLKNYNPAPFLPRKVVDSISFSSNKIEEILNHFSVDKDSERAKDIKKTIKMCEEPAGNGEVKHCATSLESMVDFTLSHPYAIHFCHDVGSTRTFMVSMVGADGTKVNAVSVCHEDTASMNPKALPFQLLNVKPGDKPICHFILDDQIALFPSQNTVLQVAENIKSPLIVSLEHQADSKCQNFNPCTFPIKTPT